MFKVSTISHIRHAFLVLDRRLDKISFSSAIYSYEQTGSAPKESNLGSISDVE